MKKPLLPEQPAESNALSIIRNETALSRYPIHRIAKKGIISIEIRNRNGVVLWEVSYNSKYGQPGPLAYKLDTLVINRKLEEVGRPAPKVIRLGSLTSVATELGLGRNTAPVRQALLQNAFAAINAKMSYRTADGTERTLEAAFTRYSVIFTGEHLPDGRRADAVYLILNDIYMEVLNTAVWRPLDYEYLKALAPAPQRFYEIVSYQIYAALKNGRSRARLGYSDYCTLSTQTRYFDWDHVKKQMHKVHAPHIRSGYIAKVEYEAAVDEAGLADWDMLYTPGPNAAAEFGAFTGGVNRGRKARRSTGKTLELPFDHADVSPQIELPAFAENRESGNKETDSGAAALLTADREELCRKLSALGVAADRAAELVATRADDVRAQLSYWPDRDRAKIKDPAGWIIRAIEKSHPAPKASVDTMQQKQRETDLRAASVRKRAEQEHEAQFREPYLTYCRSQEERIRATSVDAYEAFRVAEDEQYRGLQGRKTSSDLWKSDRMRLSRLRKAFPAEILEFWEWDASLNPNRFEGT